MRALALTLVLLAGCGTGLETTAASPCTESSASAVSTVVLQFDIFLPACIRTTVGGTVTFVNLDRSVRTVTTDAGQVESFDSGTIVYGQQFAHTFTTAGTIDLHCTYFATKATVVVVAP